jgi:hypothetical protein
LTRTCTETDPDAFTAFAAGGYGGLGSDLALPFRTPPEIVFGEGAFAGSVPDGNIGEAVGDGDGVRTGVGVSPRSGSGVGVGSILCLIALQKIAETKIIASGNNFITQEPL